MDTGVNPARPPYGVDMLTPSPLFPKVFSGRTLVFLKQDRDVLPLKPNNGDLFQISHENKIKGYDFSQLCMFFAIS
jgi:hypothetical protein